MEKQFPDAGLDVFTKDTFEEMIKCFTEMDAAAWNADEVYSLHDYRSLSQFSSNHLIYLRKDNVLIELECAYDMEITEKRIEVFSQLFERFNDLLVD